MNTAIIVAGGSGTRFGGKTPKQFLEILGKPLIIHTLERFEKCPDINQIVLVLPSAQNSNFLQIIDKYSIRKLVKIVTGGKTRAESVLNGLKSVPSKKTDIIAVHDGARPLVTPEEISACIKKANETGSAILVTSVTDTIKEIKNGIIVQTIDRNQLKRAQTPQCFRYEILKRAFEKADLTEAATDESYLVEKLGLAVAIVEGSPKNLKITTQEDLKLAESLLKKQNI